MTNKIDELFDLTGLEIGELVNKREVSAVEVTESFLDHIAENDKFNAFVSMHPDDAIKDAKEIQ